MSLVDHLHQERKARLVRLGAVPLARAPILDSRVRSELQTLQAKIEKQQIIISDLNAVVSKQRAIIRKFADETEAPTPRIIDVAYVVADHFGFTKLVIVGPQRTAPIAHARQIGYYICRELGYSWHPIGRGFGKDHSSAIHGSNKVVAMLLEKPDLANEIELIKLKIDRHVERRAKAAQEMMA